MSDQPPSDPAAEAGAEAAVAPEPVAEPVPVVEPEPAVTAAAATPPPPEPTPTVSAAEASYSRPAGSAAAPSALSPQAYDDRPEVLVGAAFAGGILAALILKRLGR